MMCANCSKALFLAGKAASVSRVPVEGASSALKPAMASRGLQGWRSWAMRSATRWRITSKALRYFLATCSRPAMTKSRMLQSWMPLHAVASKTPSGETQMQ